MTFTEDVATTELIMVGETLKAMELYYSDDVIMYENELTLRSGKKACLLHEQKNLAAIQGYKASLLSQAVDQNNHLVFTEWQFVYTTPSGRSLKLDEVSFQRWRDGKVYREKFYYKEVVPFTGGKELTGKY